MQGRMFCRQKDSPQESPALVCISHTKLVLNTPSVMRSNGAQRVSVVVLDFVRVTTANQRELFVAGQQRHSDKPCQV